MRNKEAYSRYKIIDSCLNNRFRPYPTMQDLLETCEDKLDKRFSVSTIQKDIQAMKFDQSLGFNAPIEFSRKHNGYYYSEQNYSISGVPLTEEELSNLKSVADMLSSFTGKRISETYDQAVNKIMTSLREEDLNQRNRPKLIETDPHNTQRGFENFEKLFYAVEHRIPISFVHYSYDKRRFNAVIAHPVLLKEFQSRWYLMAWSEQHKGLMTFGFDRIHEPLLLKRKYIKTDQEEIDRHTKSIYGVFPFEGESVQKIRFRTDSLFTDYLMASPLHPSQQLLEMYEHGSALFSVELIPSMELLNFFLEHSTRIHLVGPATMRKRMLKALQEAVNRYKMFEYEK